MNLTHWETSTFRLYSWAGRLVNLPLAGSCQLLPKRWSFSGDFHKEGERKDMPLSRRVSWLFYRANHTPSREETAECNSYNNCCLQVKNRRNCFLISRKIYWVSKLKMCELLFGSILIVWCWHLFFHRLGTSANCNRNFPLPLYCPWAKEK